MSGLFSPLQGIKYPTPIAKAGSEGPRSVLKSCAISRRATVLGRKWWVLGDLRVVCLVRATGHRCCGATCLRALSSSSSSPRAVVITQCAVVVAPCPLAVFSGIIACRRHHCHRLRCTLSCRLATPRAVVHRRCTVVPLSCRCRAAGSAAIVSLRRHHCAISVVTLSGVIAVVPLGAVVVPPSRCRARRRRHYALACPVPISLYPFAILLHPSVSSCHCARCACFTRLVSVLWRGAWAVGLSMGWWRGCCWGPLRVACMAVVVVVCRCHCHRFVISCN